MDNATQEVAEELVSRIYRDILENNCVIFLGAGSTTERSSSRRGFFKTIETIAGYPSSDEPPSFPCLMDYFCEKLDHGRKNRLIRETISYIETFLLPGMERRDAQEIPDALSRIPFFKRFVTTNWDPILERSLDVLIPSIEDRDLAFWDDNKRQLLKIHGSIDRPFSLVATTEDYANCSAANPLIFTKLRDLMATKTFIFLGYSRRDSDFQEVWSSIVERLGPFGRLAYAVNPQALQSEIAHWRPLGVDVCVTSDTLFLNAVAARLEKNDEIASSEFVSFLAAERDRLLQVHIRNHQTTTGELASAMYQDGLLHELDELLTSVGLGNKINSDFIIERRDREREIERAQRTEDIIEIAYYTGRYLVLDWYCKRNFKRIPSYLNPYSLAPVTRLLKGAPLSDCLTDEPGENTSHPNNIGST